MKSLISTVCAAAIAVSVVVPVNAAVISPPSPRLPSAVVKVQGTDYSGGVYQRGEPGRRFYREGWRWRDHRHWDDDDDLYWRGYKGFRHYRPGYRRHGDWWFPAAAFITGAIVGGAIASPPRVRYRSVSNAHVAWCYDRWRSYRAWDNTYQPYHGPRRECVSPYWP